MKASTMTAQFFVITAITWSCFSSLAEDCRLPSDFRMSAGFAQTIIFEEPVRGFEKILYLEIDESATNRFNNMRYLDVLRYNRDLPDFASSEIRSVLRDAFGDALREFFVEDPESSLPIVWWFTSKIEDMTSGKFVRFLLKTFAGEVEDNQLISPFDYSARGLPLQERDFSRHEVNFGLRPVSDDNPYVFLGYTAKVDGEEVVGLQLRVSLRGWQSPVPEFVARVPLRTWSLGAGARYLTEDSLTVNPPEDSDWSYRGGARQEGLSYFLGVQGPFVGGHLFLGTGYPEPLTMFFSKRF